MEILRDDQDNQHPNGFFSSPSNHFVLASVDFLHYGQMDSFSIGVLNR
jgi:hypothetical protein